MMVRIIGGHGGVSPGFRATSYLIDEKLLIDAGSVASGLQVEEQLKIDNILISHCHLDHICELAFLADNCFGMKDRPFKVWSNKTVKEAIYSHLFNDIIWPDFSKLPNEQKPTITLSEIQPEKSLVIDEYKILPVPVNHPSDAFGFIIEKKNVSVLFTQDTGPTDRIWEIAQGITNLKGIFSEVSFPNRMKKLAEESQHHTAETFAQELPKIPRDIPIFLGHLKPAFQSEVFQEVSNLGEDRITVLNSDDVQFSFI